MAAVAAAPETAVRNHGDGSARAVILAGGEGMRLRPYTAVLPKPLLPVGDQPILDIVVRRLVAAGFTQLTIAVGYLAHLIEGIFGDGSELGATIDYYYEDQPQGTAGSLASIDGLDEPFLVINGDVLTTLDLRDLERVHRESGAAFTIAAQRRLVPTEYGVVRLDDDAEQWKSVVGYEEKPEIPCLVSMGVYIADPDLPCRIPVGARFDVPELVLDLLAAGAPVGAYVFDGYWLDIGRHEDYQRASLDYWALGSFWPTPSRSSTKPTSPGPPGSAGA